MTDTCWVSPSGKAADSDSVISRVQILPPQPTDKELSDILIALYLFVYSILIDFGGKRRKMKKRLKRVLSVGASLVLTAGCLTDAKALFPDSGLTANAVCAEATYQTTTS